jgi:broad specificity phosphatase PhoE
MCSDAAVLILVRHGRTAENAAGLLLGHLDPPLDDVGREQAVRLAAALQGVSRVISSPLQRARQTAEAFRLPVEIDERWIELDYGSLDGQPAKSIGREVWDRWRHDPAFVPAGGESLMSMAERVVAACEALLPTATDCDIVVVSHVSPIKASMAWAIGAGVEAAWRSHLDQASVTRIDLSPRGPVLRSFNEVGHLGARPAPPMRISG